MNSRMTRRTLLGLATLGVALHTSVAQENPTAEGPKPPGTIVKAKAPIVIDGRLDDADWQRAKPIAANFARGKKNVVSPEPHLTVRYLWDDAYLYIGYEVSDRNLVALGNGVMKGPPGNQRPGAAHTDPAKPVDVVEFFLVFEDRNFFWELHHNALNQFTDGLCVVGLPSWQKTTIAFAGGVYRAWGEYIQDEGDRTFASAVALSPRQDGKPSTVNDASDVDTGYTGELRLPWFGIGAPAAAQTRDGDQPGPWQMTGRELSLLAAVQDGESPDQYFTSSPGTTREFFCQQTENYPRYVIRATEPWPW